MGLLGAFLGLLAGIGALLVWRSVARVPARRFRPAAGWFARRTEMLRQAGIEGVTGGQLLMIQLGVAVLAILVVLLISRSLSVSACFGVFGFFGPAAAIVRRFRDRRQVELREVWPEVVDNLTSAVRAGLSLPEAVGALGVRGPEQLRPAFVRFAADYRATGRFSDSVDTLRDALADPVGDRVLESLRMAREVGGTELGTLLRTLSAFFCGRTREQERNWRRDSPGPSTARGWRSPRRGWFYSCWQRKAARWRRTTRPPAGSCWPPAVGCVSARTG
ncbi:type II secretion system F family protein [Fodinicola feengrottensis]|uniref:type II secretion system F family protein n=1 Tax=Fodinicola feengrottensis TaxID=435914 RepID=UPI0024429092|nr:hypothetical protein [Fodinicola feengrottensis]